MFWKGVQDESTRFCSASDPYWRVDKKLRPSNAKLSNIPGVSLVRTFSNAFGLGPPAKIVGKSQGKRKNNALGKMINFGPFLGPWMAKSCQKKRPYFDIFPMFSVFLCICSRLLDHVFSLFYFPYLLNSSFFTTNMAQYSTQYTQYTTTITSTNTRTYTYTYTYTCTSTSTCTSTCTSCCSLKTQVEEGYVTSNWTRVGRSMLENGGSVVLYERNQRREHENAA